jgi:hypothetical protein
VPVTGTSVVHRIVARSATPSPSGAMVAGSTDAESCGPAVCRSTVHDVVTTFPAASAIDRVIR